MSNHEDEIDDDDIIDDETVEQPINFVPKKDYVKMRHGDKSICSTTIESAGHRMMTANFDSTVSIWDFNGMNSTACSFKTVQPCESQQKLKKVHFSSNGEHALVVSNDIQCFILDREGERVLETIKGNMYIYDARSNKGHSKSLNYACWNPILPSDFLTCSNDSSLRVWDIFNEEKVLSERRIKCHKTCIVPKAKNGQKTIPIICNYSHNGQYIAAGCADGSIQLWDPRKSAINVDMLSRDAHFPGTHISGLVFSYDGNLLATRALDDTVKIYDLRNSMKQVLHKIDGLYTTNDDTNLTFSPNDKLLLTGTSLGRGENTSYVKVFSRDNNFEEIDSIPVEDASAVTVEWHTRLNQLLVGTSKGQLYLYYDHDFSNSGALLFTKKAPRHKRINRDFYHKEVLLTYDEDTERLARIGQRASKFHEGPEISAALAARKETRKRAPTKPEEAQVKNQTYHQYMVQQLVIPKMTEEADYYENNPREAILRHANKPVYWTKGAYEKTQPVPIFEQPEDEDNDEDINATPISTPTACTSSKKPRYSS